MHSTCSNHWDGRNLSFARETCKMRRYASTRLTYAFIRPMSFLLSPECISNHATHCYFTAAATQMSNSGSSLWNVQQAVVPDWAPTYDNCSAACTAAVNTSNTYSGGVNSYRRLVNVGDSLSTGGTASIGYYGYGYCGSPTPMAYFDFGDDNLGAKTGYAYVINANTTYIILGTVSTHFLTLVNITAPYMSGADGFRRVSDIPVAWLGDSSITVNSTIYEWGFTAVTATRPPGSDGFVLLPSFVVFLLSILSALLF